MQDESYLAYVDMLGLNLPRPERVKAPLLVLGAENDRMILPSEVRATGAAYGVEAELLHTAHDMMLEAGWRQVADRILVWLSERGL